MPRRALSRLLVPAAVLAFIAAGCGGDGARDSATASPTESAATATAATPPPSATLAIAPTAAPSPTTSIEPSATPPLATPTRPAVPKVGRLRPLTFSPGPVLHQEDLYVRGGGVAGRGPWTGERVIIPSINVDAPTGVAIVGSTGAMPGPGGPQEVVWYDFSQWPGAGGLPIVGGNTVMAGDFDHPGGYGVFYRLLDLVPGDLIHLRLVDGNILYYGVEFNKTVVVTPSPTCSPPCEPSDVAFSDLLAATADESLTLITAAGPVVQGGGNYTGRRIVWARRVDCESVLQDTSPPSYGIRCDL